MRIESAERLAEETLESMTYILKKNVSGMIICNTQELPQICVESVNHYSALTDLRSKLRKHLIEKLLERKDN